MVDRTLAPVKLAGAQVSRKAGDLRASTQRGDATKDLVVLILRGAKEARGGGEDSGPGGDSEGIL